MKRLEFKSTLVFVFSMLCVGAFVTAGWGQTYKIGVHAPLTGPAAEVGRYIKNGAAMAMDDINSKGGLLGKQVEVTLGDDEAKPEVGVSVFERFVTKDKVDAVIGGLNSSVSIAIQETATKYDKIYISGGAVSELLAERVEKDPKKYWMYFKTSPAYRMLKPAYKSLFKLQESKGIFKPKKKTFATIVEDTDYGRSVVAGFQAAMKEEGWKQVANEVVKIDQADYSAQMNKLRALKPDILFTCQVSPAAAASLCKAFYKSNIPAFFLAIYTPSNPEYVNLTGEASETLVWASSIDFVPTPYGKRFIADYGKRFNNEKPGQNTGIQYDALMNYAAAVKTANSFEPRKVAEAMYKIKSEGTMGVYTFSRFNNEVVSGDDLIPTWFRQVIKRQHYAIYPEKFKERDMVAQKWMK